MSGIINRRTLSILAIIILLLLALFGYFKPPSGHQQVLSDIPLPAGARPCDQKSAYYKGFTFSCPITDSTYTLQVKNVPDGVTPYLLDVATDAAANTRQDGFCGPITVIGNMVFANNKDDKNNKQFLITTFKSPIELKISYAAENRKVDVAAPEGCQTYSDGSTVLVPVYLYSYNKNGTNFTVWKAFQNYEAGATSATVDFKVWGDPNVGISPYSVPRDFGPP
jgi:hypothetical protein